MKIVPLRTYKFLEKKVIGVLELTLICPWFGDMVTVLIWAKCQNWCLTCLPYLDSCSHGWPCEHTPLECCRRLRRGTWDQCFLPRLFKCLPECMASHPRRKFYWMFHLLANLLRWKGFGIPVIRKRLGYYRKKWS